MVSYQWISDDNTMNIGNKEISLPPVQVCQMIGIKKQNNSTNLLGTSVGVGRYFLLQWRITPFYNLELHRHRINKKSLLSLPNIIKLFRNVWTRFKEEGDMSGW